MNCRRTATGSQPLYESPYFAAGALNATAESVLQHTAAGDGGARRGGDGPAAAAAEPAVTQEQLAAAVQAAAAVLHFMQARRQRVCKPGGNTVPGEMEAACVSTPCP